jgi:GDP-mannose 6-dehydrogenase
MERVSVFGMGYVGCVSAACLARDGHQVIGMDVSATKVGRVNDGHATILEEGIEELVGAVVAAGRLRATNDVAVAIRESDISLVRSGPEPAQRQHRPHLYRRVCWRWQALRTKLAGTVVIGTVLPGTIGTW